MGWDGGAKFCSIAHNEILLGRENIFHHLSLCQARCHKKIKVIGTDGRDGYCWITVACRGV